MKTMEHPQRENKRKQVNSYVKYSGLFFQMFVIIGLFAFIGSAIDSYALTKQPYYTAGFAFAGVVVAIYQVLKEVNQMNKPNS
jgi:F0F1-type ATP synthase assembly protein I